MSATRLYMTRGGVTLVAGILPWVLGGTKDGCTWYMRPVVGNGARGVCQQCRDDDGWSPLSPRRCPDGRPIKGNKRCCPSSHPLPSPSPPSSIIDTRAYCVVALAASGALRGWAGTPSHWLLASSDPCRLASPRHAPTPPPPSHGRQVMPFLQTTTFSLCQMMDGHTIAGAKAKARGGLCISNHSHWSSVGPYI